MSGKNKNQKELLKKLGIDELNQMQIDAYETIQAHPEIILLSPTGTGKTLAFLLPIIDHLDPDLEETQVLVLVPSRELAIQIEQVMREMGSGYKVNAIYGGRAVAKDRIDLKHPPTVLIGTPGRIADHMRRETIHLDHIKTLVLDEFDKSLETGFEKDMKEIILALPNLKKKVLTSATQKIAIPSFAGIKAPKKLNFLSEKNSQLSIKIIESPTKDKLESLEKLLGHVGKGRGIIFCNFKETIKWVSEHLQKRKIDHACFYGGMEQQDRERALIKFRNGTHRRLLATDLAARGIDVPELDFIIHFQLPFKKEEFTHRNGRTARMHSEGTAFLIKVRQENLPDYIEEAKIEELPTSREPLSSKWQTLFISGGRKDKISKGDIAGLFFKQGGLKKGELGVIELKQDCAFVSVPKAKTRKLVEQLNNSRLKKKKVRIYTL